MTPAEAVADAAVREISRRAAREFTLAVEGIEHVPAAGPAIVAARHYHHLHDGAAIVRAVHAAYGRTPKVFVALDWTRTRLERAAMETACRLAGWPIALRGENLDGTGASAFDRRELVHYTRAAVETGAAALARGKVLLIFPEGHPTVDPVRSRKDDDAAFLPFRAGVIAVAARARALGAGGVPIVPAGFAYRREDAGYAITLRFGPRLEPRPGATRAATLAELEARVRELSRTRTDAEVLGALRAPLAGIVAELERSEGRAARPR